MSDHSDVLAILGVVLFERVKPASFQALGEVPDWMAHLGGFEDGEEAILQPGGELFFLENFLVDAEEFWAKETEGYLRSGIWCESGPQAKELFLEAFVFTAHGRRLLAIELLDETYDERQRLLQSARETSLSLDSLRREVQKKEVLLHCIVHDLRSPLTGIVGALSLVLAKDLTPEKTRTLLEMGMKAARKQESMIRGVLEVFSAEVAALESFDQDPEKAPDVVRVGLEAVERFQPAYQDRGVELVWEPGAGVGDSLQVIGREDRLERVLGNLIDNALRYSPTNSTVRLGVEDEGETVLVYVEDEGPGVPENREHKLFARFSSGRDRPGAAGLGLYFCRIMVEQWGGEIGYTTGREKGARFWFRLPKLGHVDEVE